MLFTKVLSIFGLRFTPKRNYQPFPSKQLILRTKTVLSSFTSWFISKCFLSTRNFYRKSEKWHHGNVVIIITQLPSTKFELRFTQVQILFAMYRRCSKDIHTFKLEHHSRKYPHPSICTHGAEIK